MRYLEIAAKGKRSPEWTAVRDVAHKGVDVWDVTNMPFPYDNDTFDGIYSEHFIEHIFKYQGINFFRDCFRILKSGGVIRTVWPPMDFVLKLVCNDRLDRNEQFFVQQYYARYVKRHNFAPSGSGDKTPREQCALGLLYQNGEHRHLWGIAEMKDELKKLGFKNVVERRYGQSGLRAFGGIDTKCKIRAAHSAVIEATKP